MSADADATKQIVAHLMGIPFFDRLTEEEVEKSYSICRVAKYEPDQVIYKFGTASHPSRRPTGDPNQSRHGYRVYLPHRPSRRDGRHHR